MRARYTAYVQGNIDFLRITTLPIQQAALDILQMTRWSQQTEWRGLQVISHQLATHSQRHAWVIFTVSCREDERYTHHRRSAFVRDAESWRFIDPTVSLKAESVTKPVSVAQCKNLNAVVRRCWVNIEPRGDRCALRG